MKPQLRPGAREALNLIYNDLNAAREYLRNDSPGAADKLIRKVLERLQYDIEPKLQRANGDRSLDERVAVLEEQLQTLLEKV